MKQEQEKNENNIEVDIAAPPVQAPLIIDIIKVCYKAEITKSDVYLSIIEICSFPARYKYTCSNKTYEFWSNAKQADFLKIIFNGYKSETLRKLWKIIRDSKNITKFVEIVKNNVNFIDDKSLWIMPVCTALSFYILNNYTRSFPEYYTEYSQL